jgi:hypothetical protein
MTDITMIDQLTERDRIELLARAQDAWDRAPQHNESGFRMAWKKLRRLALVSSATHSHRGGHQGLLNGMSAALDFQGDPATTKAQSKLFVLHPVRRFGRTRPPLPSALKKSTTRLRGAATRDKGSSRSMGQSGALGAVGGGRPLRRPYFSSGFGHRSLVCQVSPARH